MFVNENERGINPVGAGGALLPHSRRRFALFRRNRISLTLTVAPLVIGVGEVSRPGEEGRANAQIENTPEETRRRWLSKL